MEERKTNHEDTTPKLSAITPWQSLPRATGSQAAASLSKQQPRCFGPGLISASMCTQRNWLWNYPGHHNYMFIRDQDSIVLALTVVESDITNENKLGFALFSYHFFLTAWRTVVSCTPNTSDPSFRGTQTLNCLLTTLVEGLHSSSSANRTPHELTGAGRSSEAPPRLAAPSSPCSAPCPRAPRAFLQAGREPSSLHLEQVLRCAALKALFSGRTASLKSL